VTALFPEIDFNETPLSSSSKRQLAGITRTISRPDGAGRTGLRGLILKNVFDESRGTYVPIGHDVYLEGKLPQVSRTLFGIGPSTDLHPFPGRYFTNGLLIPAGYGTATFNVAAAPKPSARATNIGFLVATIEFECVRPELFEENLAWTRCPDADGDFSDSPFAELDRELGRLREYRGFSIVFSGNKPIHFHFIFSTEHLVNAPSHAVAWERGKEFRGTSALLHNAHKRYWDHVHETFIRCLNPSIPADPRLRSLTQWRRTPWGIRLLEKPSVLGFPAGARIPQLVIREKLLRRSPKSNDGFLVPETFSLAHPIRAGFPRNADFRIEGFNDLMVVELLEEICFTEWGEWPKPTDISIQDGEWLFRFRNHEGDRNPSTIVLGDYRQLQLNGHHSFGARRFYLPDQMTAQELGNHLAERLGWKSLEEGSGVDEGSQPDHFVVQDVAVRDRDIAKRAYREVLRREAAQRSDLGMASIILSVEGIGKTTAHLSILANEALNDALAHSDRVERFAGFAFRSRRQAHDKAREFGRTHPIRVIKTFWEHYNDACLHEGRGVIPRDEFEETNPGDILIRIRNAQTEVFARLEETRAALWGGPSERFDAGSTLLCLTHKAAQLWPSGILTRAWHHPDFVPLGNTEQHAHLRDRFRLNRIVFDDCELDDFVHIFPESVYGFLSLQQKRHPDWRNIPRPKRLHVYRRLQDDIPRGRVPDFDSFDELMRLDIATLDSVEVNFDAIPFGYDNSQSGIYRRRHGDRYYVGPKPWLIENSAEFTFLTTESLVARVIERASHRPVTKFILDQVPPIYPVKVPVQLDRRAAADRTHQRRVSALAAEIAANNDNAIVLADGVRGVERAITFQGMKGQNGFTEKDIAIIPTCLAPEKFAELNVVGQWLGINDAIDRYYDDQINQAVGRNRAFRLSDLRATTTRVITSPRLWRQVFKKRTGQHRRTQLYIAEGS
jgi:hypothetical protein